MRVNQVYERWIHTHSIQQQIEHQRNMTVIEREDHK